MTLEEKVIDFISRYHCGNSNPVSACEIARVVNLLGFNTNQEEVQRMIGDIRRAKKALIGSNSSGFFLIQSEEDNAITQAYLRGRVGPIIRAAEAVEQMWKEKNGGAMQGVLL